MNLSAIIAQTQAQLDALVALQGATETLEAMGLRVQIVEAAKAAREEITPKPQQRKAEAIPEPVTEITPSKPEPAPKNGRASQAPAQRWTEYEDRQAVEMAVNGKKSAQIAKALGRPEPGTAWRLKVKLAERIRAAKAIEEGIEVDPMPVKPNPVIARAPAPREGFTPELDVILVENISQGWKLPYVAQSIGVTEEAARARWNELKPDPLTFEAQTKLLAQLKHIAAQQEAQ